MQSFKLTLAYDGTDFAGFQRQSNARSVQQVLRGELEGASWRSAPDLRGTATRRRHRRRMAELTAAGVAAATLATLAVVVPQDSSPVHVAAGLRATSAQGRRCVGAGSAR